MKTAVLIPDFLNTCSWKVWHKHTWTWMVYWTSLVH